MDKIGALTTKEKLVDSAGKLFSKKGFEGVSVRDISTNAGVQLSAIAYHFKTKENLYIESLKFACKESMLSSDEERAYIKKNNGLLLYIQDVLKYYNEDYPSWYEELIIRELTDQKTKVLYENYFIPLYHFLKKLLAKTLKSNNQNKEIEFGVTFLFSFANNYNDFLYIYNLIKNRKAGLDFSEKDIAIKIYNMTMISMGREDFIIRGDTYEL